MDYIFLAAQQGVNIFTVAIGEILQINHGVTIWLDQNVELQVSGRMVNTGVGEGQIVFSRRIVEGSERGAWRAIHLIGDGDFNDADGIINLDECLIEGGGAGDDPDNDGLIVLSGDRPELTIGEPILMPVSELRYSESNGIVSITGAIQWRGRIILINAYMNDEERSIARVGVKMGDSDINNYIWDTTLLRIDHCTITDCGSHGIAVYHFQGGDYQIIDTSKVNFNGQDQELGFGAGILFENPDQIYFQNGSILVEDSQINNNTRDGIRLWQCNAAVSILKSEIQYNDGCGILDNLEGDCWPTYFDKNYIAYNGLSGVHAYKAGAWYEAAVLIRGNRFVSNGTAVNEVEVANIRIRGTISRTMFGQPGWVMSEINNNIISGGNTGISIGRVQFVGEFRVPDCIHIQNNIQSSAGIQGLHIDDIGFGENPNPAMVFPTEISNNIFYGNGFEAEENDGSGIWIGEDSRSFMGHEEVIRNNLLIANTDFGIQYIPIELGSPEFDFNGFDDNGANTFGCDLGVNTIVADPRFVDADGGDFHLLWNSPMINRGDDDPDFNDANYPSAEQIPRDGSRNDIGAYGGPGAADYGFDPYCAIDAAHNVVTNANLPDDPDNGGRDWLEWDYYKVFGDITSPNGEVFDIGNPDFEERDEDEIGRAWFEFVADAGWSVNGAGDFHANGNNVLDENDRPLPDQERTIYFKRANTDNQWDGIRITASSDDSWLYGCVIDGANRPLEFIGVIGGGGVPKDIIVNNCDILNAGQRGIFISNRFKLICWHSLVENSNGSGIYLSSNEQANDADRSQLNHLTIRNNCLNELTSDAGVWCYQSDPILVGCHIHNNLELGVYASYGGNPRLQPPNFEANNIYNNGEVGEHSSTSGSEVRISSASGYDYGLNIFGNNIYDVRFDEEEEEWVREGKIISRTTSTTGFTVQDNYFGNDREEGVNNFVWANDTYQHNGTDFNQGAVLNAALVEDLWGVDSDPAPENDFRLGIIAMESGDLERAAALFRRFTREYPSAPEAAAAPRMLVLVERDLGINLTELRQELLELAESEEAALAWVARKAAAKCLFESGQLEDARADFASIRESAPDEVEALLVDVEVMHIEEILAAPGLDAVGSRAAHISALFERIEEIEGKQAETALRNAIPERLELIAVFPNPFNSTVRIAFSIPETGPVSIGVYDLTGREVTNSTQTFVAGNYSITWNGANQPTGLYFLKIEAAGQTVSQKLILVK